MTVGLPDLTLLTPEDVVSSRRKTLWTVIRGMFKLRSIWVSPASSSDWPAIFSLVSKSSSFLEALLSEIEVNGVLLSIVNEVKEGELFWRVAFSRFSRRLFRTNCTYYVTNPYPTFDGLCFVPLLARNGSLIAFLRQVTSVSNLRRFSHTMVSLSL